jgi:hypothetical protein
MIITKMFYLRRFSSDQLIGKLFNNLVSNSDVVVCCDDKRELIAKYHKVVTYQRQLSGMNNEMKWDSYQALFGETLRIVMYDNKV